MPITAVARAAAASIGNTNGRAESDNLGPLMTIFTPPSACSNPLALSISFDSAYKITKVLLLAGGVKCKGDTAIPDIASCWPQVTNSRAMTGTGALGFDGLGYYSPGIYCPSGYFNAYQEEGPESTDFIYSIGPSETIAGCCPV